MQQDETVVLFDTAARPSGDGGWIVPVHGWAYEPANSRIRKAALATALKAGFGLRPSPQTQANFDRRANLFFADNERGKRVHVEVAGQRIALPPSRPNGHFGTDLRLGAEEVLEHAAGTDALALRLVLAGGERSDFSGRAHLVAARGTTIVSDIDDTVKISEVRDRAALLDNTFFRDFRAVPGMAAKYREWAALGASFHFVSSSPWQLYAPLSEFLERAGFPEAVLHLKSVRFKDETLLDLFEPGTKTKPLQIEPLLDQFPERRFVLVGDSGEKDPEVYAALMRRFPERIERVYIRNVTASSPGDARFEPLFEGIDPARWDLFTDPSRLELPEISSIQTNHGAE